MPHAKTTSAVKVHCVRVSECLLFGGVIHLWIHCCLSGFPVWVPQRSDASALGHPVLPRAASSARGQANEGPSRLSRLFIESFAYHEVNFPCTPLDLLGNPSLSRRVGQTRQKANWGLLTFHCEVALAISRPHRNGSRRSPHKSFTPLFPGSSQDTTPSGNRVLHRRLHN